MWKHPWLQKVVHKRFYSPNDNKTPIQIKSHDYGEEPMDHGVEESCFNQALSELKNRRLAKENINKIKSHPWFKYFDWEALEKKEMVSPL